MLLTGTVSASNHTKCSSLSSRKCMTEPTLYTIKINNKLK